MWNLYFLMIWLMAWLSVNDEDWTDDDYVSF